MNTPEIIIIVERGLIQDIKRIPPGIIVEVRDYDTDGSTGQHRKDKNGAIYRLSTWEGGE